jgi:hypothetical protein
MIDEPIRAAGFLGALLLSLLLGVGSAGCRDEFVAVSPQPPFEGIQITFEDGRMGGTIGDPSDDWLPLTDVGARLSGAYPNPVIDKTSIDLSLAGRDSIRLWMESSPGVFDREFVAARLEAGVHVFDLDLTDHSPGIYRLYMTVYREGAHTTYGDIMVKR